MGQVESPDDADARLPLLQAMPPFLGIPRLAVVGEREGTERLVSCGLAMVWVAKWFENCGCSINSGQLRPLVGFTGENDACFAQLLVLDAWRVWDCLI